MPNIREQAQAFLDMLERLDPETFTPIRNEIYQYAKSAAARLDKVDTEECKKAKLAQILLFRAVNYHKYGDPATNPPLKQLLMDLSDCFARSILNSVTQEQLDLVLIDAMEHVFDPDTDKPFWEETPDEL